MSKPSPARYRTTNWSSYNASLRKRGSLLIWVDKDMTLRAPCGGRPGRPPTFSDAAVQFCLSIKVLFKLPLRQTAGMVASLLKLAGLDWPVPDFSTLCRRQKTLAVQIPYRRADGPLNLLVDIEPGSATGSSEPARGIKFLGDREWRWRMAGTQARHPSQRPISQGVSGDGHGHWRHPGGGVHPKPRGRQPRLAGPSGSDPEG